MLPRILKAVAPLADVLVFCALIASGLSLRSSQIIAFATGVGLSWLLTLRVRAAAAPTPWRAHLELLLVTLLALFLRGGVLACKRCLEEGDFGAGHERRPICARARDALPIIKHGDLGHDSLLLAGRQRIATRIRSRSRVGSGPVVRMLPDQRVLGASIPAIGRKPHGPVAPGPCATGLEQGRSSGMLRGIPAGLATKCRESPKLWRAQ